MKKKLIILSIIISIVIILVIIGACICFKQPSKEVASNSSDNNNISSNTTFEDVDTDIANSLNHTLQSQLELNEDFVFSSAIKHNTDTVMTYTYKEDFTVQFTLSKNGNTKSFSILIKNGQNNQNQNLLDLIINLLDKNILILTQEEKYFIIEKAFDDTKPYYILGNLTVLVQIDNIYMLSVIKNS